MGYETAEGEVVGEVVEQGAHVAEHAVEGE